MANNHYYQEQIKIKDLKIKQLKEENKALVLQVNAEKQGKEGAWSQITQLERQLKDLKPKKK